MCSTTTIARRELPYPTNSQFAALQRLLDAYYGLNAAGRDDPRQRVTPWEIERDNSPMDLVRRALVKSLKFLPGVTQTAARRIFNACIESGENVQWIYDHWLVGEV